MRRFVLLLALPLLLAVSGCYLFQPERFVVFFAPFSSDLDAPAKQVIATVGEKARQRPAAMVTVSGYASTSGTAAANQKLSADRARTVEQALVAAGVPASRITRHALGEVDFTMDPIESRRVEITLGTN